MIESTIRETTKSLHWYAFYYRTGPRRGPETPSTLESLGPLEWHYHAAHCAAHSGRDHVEEPCLIALAHARRPLAKGLLGKGRASLVPSRWSEIATALVATAASGNSVASIVTSSAPEFVHLRRSKVAEAPDHPLPPEVEPSKNVGKSRRCGPSACREGQLEYVQLVCLSDGRLNLDAQTALAICDRVSDIDGPSIGNWEESAGSGAQPRWEEPGKVREALPFPPLDQVVDVGDFATNRLRCAQLSLWPGRKQTAATQAQIEAESSHIEDRALHYPHQS